MRTSKIETTVFIGKQNIPIQSHLCIKYLDWGDNCFYINDILSIYETSFLVMTVHVLSVCVRTTSWTCVPSARPSYCTVGRPGWYLVEWQNINNKEHLTRAQWVYLLIAWCLVIYMEHQSVLRLTLGTAVNKAGVETRCLVYHLNVLHGKLSNCKHSYELNKATKPNLACNILLANMLWS